MFEKIQDHLLQFSKETCLIQNDQTFTYRSLIEEIKKLSQSEKHGIKNSRVGIYGEYSFSCLALLFQLFKDSNIVSMIPSQCFSPIEKARESSCQFLYKTDGPAKAEMPPAEKIENPSNYSLIEQLSKKNHAGLIVSTTGSGGRSKLILHDAELIFQKFMSGKTPLRTLSLYFLDHFGGLNTTFRILLSGGCLIVPASRRPVDVIESIEKHQVELLPCTPTFLNLLLQSDDFESNRLRSLKIISYGAESMASSLLDQAVKKLPWVEFKQVYGLSEFGIVPATSEKSSSLWLEIHEKRNVQFKIEKDVLYLKGPTTMLGYLGEDNSIDDDGWFCTEDRVEKKGNLIRILGRERESIRVADFRVEPINVEQVILSHSQVKEVRVFAIPNDQLNNLVAAEVVPTKDVEHFQDLALELKRLCSQTLDKYHAPVVIRRVDSLKQIRLKTERSF